MLDGILRTVVKQLCAISTLQQKRFTRRDICQLFPQTINLSGRDQRRQSPQFGQDGVEVRLVPVSDVLGMSPLSIISPTCAIGFSLHDEGDQGCAMAMV